MPHRVTFAWLLGWACAAFLTASLVAAQESADTLFEGEPIDSGYIVIDGDYLARPYRVGVLGDQITINGRVVGDSTLFFARRSDWSGPRDNGGRQPDQNARPAGGQQGGADAGSPSSRESGTSTNDGRRFDGGGRYGFRMEGYIERRLREGNLILVVTGRGVVTLPGPMLPVYIEIVSSSEDASAKVQELVALSNRPVHSAVWRAIVDDYRAEPALLAEAKRIDKELKQAEAERAAAQAGGDAGEVMHWLTPVLAAAAVLAALAVLIRTHRATLLLSDEYRGWRHIDPTGMRTRVVVQLVAVLLLLNGLDLLFTILAQRTGQFVELSPVGGKLITDAVALGFYKSTLVALGVGILLFLRQRRAAEVTAWWLCAVYVLVLVRWAAVNTLLVS